MVLYNICLTYSIAYEVPPIERLGDYSHTHTHNTHTQPNTYAQNTHALTHTCIHIYIHPKSSDHTEYFGNILNSLLGFGKLPHYELGFLEVEARHFVDQSPLQLRNSLSRAH